eukprot:scaffold112917_cov22-Tisochrysis_lutea.AAC.1
MGKEQPQSGSVRMGEYNIVPNYFEQNQAEALDPNLTVLNTLIQVGGIQFCILQTGLWLHYNKKTINQIRIVVLTHLSDATSLGAGGRWEAKERVFVLKKHSKV